MSEHHQKANQGKTAAFVWLAGGAALFLWDGGLTNLLRWQAFVYIFVGMFVAAGVVGAINHFIHFKVANHLSENWSIAECIPGQQSQRFFSVGYALLAVRWGLSVLFLLWCYNSFFWMQG